MITFLAELLLFSFIATLIAERGKRINNFGKSILVSPIRYTLLFFDLYVIATFLYDILTRKEKKWRK